MPIAAERDGAAKISSLGGAAAEQQVVERQSQDRKRVEVIGERESEVGETGEMAGSSSTATTGELGEAEG